MGIQIGDGNKFTNSNILDLSSQLLLHFYFYLLFGQILFAGLRGGFDG